MSQLPNYQITANPVSTFETYGEGAPAAPAAMPGTPAAPVVNPLLGKLASLSQTAAGFFAEKQRRQAIKDVKTGKQLSPEEYQQILEENRKGNALSVAGLVDKGIMAPAENPYVQMGQKVAIAGINSDMMTDYINANLAADFEKDTDGIRTSDDPRAAGAAYLSRLIQGADGLNVDKSFEQDYYYSSALEKRMGSLRGAFQKSLMGLRVERASLDFQQGIKSSIIKAVQPVDETVPQGIVRVPAIEIENIIADPQNRAAFGSNFLNETAGLYLVELAAQGNPEALDALKTSKLSNGQNLIQASKAVEIEYESKKPVIERKMQEVFNQGLGARNQKLRETVEQQFIQAFSLNQTRIDDMSIKQIADQMGGLVSRTTTGWAINLPNKDGTGVTQTTINMNALAEESRKVAFERRFASLMQLDVPDGIRRSDLGMDEMTARIVAAAETTRNNGEYKDQVLDARLRRGVGSINALMSDPGRAVNADGSESLDSQQAMDALMHYRRMQAEVGMAAQYFSAEEQANLYILDLLEQGSQGPLGQLSDSQMPSGIVSAVSRMKGFDDKASSGERGKLKEALREKIPERLRGDPGMIAQLIAIGEVQVALTNGDGEKVANSLLEDFVRQGDNFIFSSLHGPTILKGDGKVLLSDAVEFAADPSNKATEGSIAADIRAIAEEQTPLGEKKSDWIRENIHFVSAKGPQKALMLAAKDGTMWQGSRLYNREALEQDLRVRVSGASAAKQEAIEEQRNALPPAPEGFIRSIKEPFIMQGVRGQDSSSFLDKMEGGGIDFRSPEEIGIFRLLDFNSPEEIKEMQKKHREIIEGAFDPLNSVRFPTDRQVIDTFMDVVNWIGKFAFTPHPNSALGRRKEVAGEAVNFGKRIVEGTGK